MIPLLLLATVQKDTLSETILGRIGELNPKLGLCIRVQITHALLDAAERSVVPPLLLCALVTRESNFNPNAWSSSGAIGLGQLKPETAKVIGIDDPWDIRKNLLATAEYLRWMLDEFEGRKRWVELALAAYRLGPKAVQDEEVLKRPEIMRYIQAILSEWANLRGRAGLLALRRMENEVALCSPPPPRCSHPPRAIAIFTPFLCAP